MGWRQLSKKGKVRRAALVGLPLLALLTPVAANLAVLSQAKGRIYSDPHQVPHNRVALVLGTAPNIAGRKNLYFERRMQAAASLYRAGKAEKLLVSGDNGRVGYDEPTAMKAHLIRLGVPESAIACDYAGFRTLDSLARAKRVFGLDRLTVVTDDFHLPRALFLARSFGIDAVGFSTEPVPTGYSAATEIRELGARTLVCVDVLFRRQPRFYGPKEDI